MLLTFWLEWLQLYVYFIAFVRVGVWLLDVLIWYFGIISAFHL
jgi:hypothetical protein